MSIKLNQIEMSAKHEKKDVRIRARLVLSNEMTVPALVIVKDARTNLTAMIKKHEDQLRKSMIHFIYGDLLEPINELAILAQHHITGQNDADEIKELRTKIDNIMKGL